MHGDVLFWIWLSEQLGAANHDFKTLIALYGNPYDLFHTEESELDRIPGLSPRTRQVLADKNLQRAAEILDRCERGDIGVVTYSDEAYPSLLRELKNPPVLLYYKGSLPDWNHKLAIGMVGTRRMSAYGLHTAYKIAFELTSAGGVVVSGMAAGIDGVSAAAAVLAGGCTVAVLGCGVDVVYPKHHKSLMDEICKRGAVVSEYAPGTRPNHYHFPIRNRIISGMTVGTLVVEAGVGSGSLITAKEAVLQGRDVFAVPANVGSVGAEGTNGLLRDGAHLVLDTTDIFDRYLYAYADSIDLEAYHREKPNAKTDLHALERLGVIELDKTPKTRPASGAVASQGEQSPKRAEAPPPPKKRTCAPRKKSGETSAPEEKKAEPAKNNDPTLTTLTSVQLAVMQAMPDDHPVTADSLGNLGYPYSEIIAALTMLEILGLIRKLPGALYTKA